MFFMDDVLHHLNSLFDIYSESNSIEGSDKTIFMWGGSTMILLDALYSHDMHTFIWNLKILT